MLSVSLTEKIVAEKFTKLYIYIRFLITEATKMSFCRFSQTVSNRIVDRGTFQSN